ncbi:2,3-dihydro-2,3-dihydroxybenzoate dehydrogenase [Actinokineospora enzanensis]|uniref:2,3-dihydro-2,3-dihydroxybenzoate dehydrogenase n=1 Tax=Actinokineospora enzanensis TaxID=155975 RepID=UPI00036BDC90|nr:2,3-dihydro-2,3-dihydroxybenzoate dehydrogenase [Actinokineospora enzanensis]
MEHGIAIVTGAAGGIGAVIARALGECGVLPAVVDRDAERLDAVVGELARDGIKARAFPCDVGAADAVEALVAAVEEELGPVRYLVNAAGVLRLGPIVELTAADWVSTFAVNAAGVFLVSQAVARRMVARRAGAIVTVASNAADVPRVGMGAYGASKAAATMFTKTLGLELAAAGIRCNVVAPGSTDSPMLRGMWNGPGGRAATIDGDQAAYRVGIPLRRIAEPRDVADAVLFLLGDAAAHITMHELVVDGGAALGA